MQRNHGALVARKKPKSKVSKVKRNKTPYERTDQTRVCDWSEAHGLLFYSIPNDGKRSPRAAAMAKATGLKKGMLDLHYPMPRAPWHSLYIEMKRKEGGKLDKWQKYWVDALRSQGNFVAVCKGYDEAIAVLKEYFGDSI